MNQIKDFTRDAEEWGSALNEAAWKFIDVCPEKSATLFNTCKGALREAILVYAQKIALSTPRAAEAVPEELASLLCNAFDNLNDLPINDDWAYRWCRQFEKTDFGKRLLASALTPPSAKGK